EHSEQRYQEADRLGQPLPDSEARRNHRIRRKPAVQFGLRRVVQHIDHVRPTDRLRVVDAGVSKARMFPKLGGPGLRHLLHLSLGAEMQAPGRASLYASRLQTLAYTVRAQRAFVDLLRFRIEFRNIIRAARHTVLAPDAVVLVKIDNAVSVLHDRAVRRTGPQAARVLAVH